VGQGSPPQNKKIMKARVYSGYANGEFVQIKAFKKCNAIARYKQLDPDFKESSMTVLNLTNAEQSTVESLYPEICK